MSQDSTDQTRDSAAEPIVVEAAVAGRGCAWVMVIIFLLLVLQGTVEWLAPHVRSPKTAVLTIIDEQQNPVEGAELSVHESESLGLLTQTLFASPSFTNGRERTFAANPHGVVTFDVKFNSAFVPWVMLNGARLKLISTTFPRYSGPYSENVVNEQLPNWNMVHENANAPMDFIIRVARPRMARIPDPNN